MSNAFYVALSVTLSSALRLVLLGKNGHRGACKWREGESDTIVDARANVDAERPTLRRSEDGFDMLKRGGRRRGGGLR